MSRHLAPLLAAAIALAAACDMPGSLPLERASRVPVLAYHQMDRPGELFTVTSADFRAQMAYLAEQGYHAIGMADYLAWRKDPDHPLPARPVLITFDDNNASAELATPILEEHGFKAVMFVATGCATNPENRYGERYTSWDGLGAMSRSGAWEFAFHAGPQGHDLFPEYECTSFYPCRRPGEAAEQYESRVIADLLMGLEELTDHFPDWAPGGQKAFAVPFSDYGQLSSDTAVTSFLAPLFQELFDVIFVQSESDQVHAQFRYRFGLTRHTTLQQFSGVVENEPAFRWDGLTWDVMPPVIHSFLLSDPASGSTVTTGSPTVKVTIEASDDVGVSGWYLSENPWPPPDDSAFARTPPTDFALSPGGGTRTAYLWVQDWMGNVSPPAVATITAGGEP